MLRPHTSLDAKSSEAIRGAKLKRRDLLKKILGLGAIALGTHLPYSRLSESDNSAIQFTAEPELHPALAEVFEALMTDEGAQTLATLASASPILSEAEPGSESAAAETPKPVTPVQPESETVDDPLPLASAPDGEDARLEKIRRFNEVFTDDIFLTSGEYATLIAALKRINRVQAYVGHGNFNILAFDDMLNYARGVPEIGRFRQDEKALMDRLFHDDASQLGFFGKKVIVRMTHRVPKREVIKVPYTGHYLYKGDALKLYERLRDDIGDRLILTSGVRSVVKQYQLFMAKAVASAGNLSKASRSLAPPGHSYHGIGDFDVGKVGFHINNFTAAFAQTDVCRELQRLDYIGIRYTTRNKYGVRYEPWHMRVVL